MSGIDYGMGRTNIDNDTGIRYGVISQHSVPSDCMEDVYSNGVDEDYAESLANLRSRLQSSLKSVLEDYSGNFDVEAIAEDIINGLDIDYEGTGDFTRYSYEHAGLQLTTDSQGDLFITESPYYTLCSFCSPCAPGAGYLTTPGDVKAYCLGPDWFNQDQPMPYACYRVADDSAV
jgi:hypothetical protein